VNVAKKNKPIEWLLLPPHTRNVTNCGV